LIQKTIISFLNHKGGRILFGVFQGKISGCFMTLKEQDEMTRKIDSLVFEIRPQVDPQQVTISYIPVKDDEQTFSPGLYVPKIIVREGDPKAVYYSKAGAHFRNKKLTKLQDMVQEIKQRALLQVQDITSTEYNDLQPEFGAPIITKSNLNSSTPIKRELGTEERTPPIKVTPETPSTAKPKTIKEKTPVNPPIAKKTTPTTPSLTVLTPPNAKQTLQIPNTKPATTILQKPVNIKKNTTS
jgi:hypothetical protein